MCFISSRKVDKILANTAKHSLEHFDLYSFKCGNADINLYVSRKRASIATHIHCTESGDVIWEQFYLFGGMSRPAREKKYVLRLQKTPNFITLVAIRGVPGNITGLDDEMIKSYKSKPELNNIYLMTERNVTGFLESI